MRISSPLVARRYRIGMVHQHFKLVPSFSVAENVFLGQEPTRGGIIDMDAAVTRVDQLSRRFGFAIDPRSRIQQLSMGQRQRVEILKALSYDAEILILDEPTVTAETDLTPVRLQQSDHHVHQGGFAGTVLPHHRMNLAGQSPKVDMVVGHQTAKALGDPSQLEDWKPRIQLGDRRRRALQLAAALRSHEPIKTSRWSEPEFRRGRPFGAGEAGERV